MCVSFSYLRSIFWLRSSFRKSATDGGRVKKHRCDGQPQSEASNRDRGMDAPGSDRSRRRRWPQSGGTETLPLVPTRHLLSRTFPFGQCQSPQPPDLSPLHQAKGDQAKREKRPDHAKDDYVDFLVGRSRHGCEPQQKVYTPLEDIIRHRIEVLRRLARGVVVAALCVRVRVADWSPFVGTSVPAQGAITQVGWCSSRHR